MGRMMSTDGLRLFFSLGDQGECGDLESKGGCDGLYMRQGGVTTPISVSQRTGEVGEVGDGMFHDASTDGSVVYFTSRQPLTDESWSGKLAPNSYGSLYRYDVDRGELRDLTVTSDPDEPFVVGGAFYPTTNADGSSVYFVAAGVLAPGAVAGNENLYVWHEDPRTHAETLRLVMTASRFVETGINETGEILPLLTDLRVSPNGLYAVVQTAGPWSGSPRPTVRSTAASEGPVAVCGSTPTTRAKTSSAAPPVRRDRRPSGGTRSSVRAPRARSATTAGSSSRPRLGSLTRTATASATSTSGRTECSR